MITELIMHMQVYVGFCSPCPSNSYKHPQPLQLLFSRCAFLSDYVRLRHDHDQACRTDTTVASVKIVAKFNCLENGATNI